MTTEGNEKGKDSINLQKNLHTDLLGYARIIKNVGTSHETPGEEIPSEVKICFSSRSSAVQYRFQDQRKKREESKMSVNFFPNREQMLKEIEGCVASSKLDVLLGLCTCCVYKSYDEGPLVSQCLKCSVQQGIMKISNKKKLADAPDLEFLRVC